MMLILLLVSLLFLILLGLPMAMAIGIPSLIYIILDDSVPSFIAIQRMVAGPNSYALLAVPFFIFAGNLMNISGITNRIFGFANKLVGHLRGGLGHVNVVASMIFAGMSGAATADAGGLGIIEIEAMRRAGYDDRMTIGITAASSTIGPIIPPSIVIVVYGVVSSSSIGRLFAAGLVPGFAMGLSLMILIYFVAGKYKAPVEPKSTIKEVIKALGSSVLSLLTPLIILGGIFFGIFTPTEAAGIASFYALILGFFVYKELDFKSFLRVVKESAFTTVKVIFILASATLLAWILAKERVPQMVAQLFLSISDNKTVILLLINLMLLLVGLFMENIAAINILVPVLMPVINQLGIDPVQFGIIVILNLNIGLLTPPFGEVLFVLSGVAKTPVEVVAKSTAIYIIPLLIVLLLITLVPEITLWLPNLLYGK